jgi:uncharacterized protein involved in exopolysaccharide biosynthesis
MRLEDDEIDLREFFAKLWRSKWLIFLCACIFSIAAGVYAFITPNVYESDVLLAPVLSDNRSQVSSLAGQLGGIASLAGINIGGGDSQKIHFTLQILHSRKFIGDFITRHELLASLLATKGWDRSTKSIQYKEIYDPQTKEWAEKNGISQKPTLLDAVDFFRKLMSVEFDTKNNVVRLSLEFYSPILLQQWLTWLVEDLNNEVRLQDMIDSQNNIKYLTQQVNKTSLSDTKAMLYRLIEQQIQTLMLTKVREEYVLTVIDPAIVPEYPFKPKKEVIIIVGFILGGMLAVVILLIRQFVKSDNTN